MLEFKKRGEFMFEVLIVLIILLFPTFIAFIKYKLRKKDHFYLKGNKKPKPIDKLKEGQPEQENEIKSGTRYHW